MSDLRGQIGAAVACLEFVNEDEEHDDCPWCEIIDQPPVADLLTRAADALDALTARTDRALVALEQGRTFEAQRILKGEA